MGRFFLFFTLGVSLSLSLWLSVQAAASLSSGLVFRDATLEVMPAVREPHGAGAPEGLHADRADAQS